MNLLHKLKPGVPKQVLVLLGASLWGFASYRILKLGFIKIDSNAGIPWLNYVTGILGFIPFYWFVFRKVSKRYVLRIINLESARPCIFAFFNVRAYLLMTFMITMGILLSHWPLIPELYKGTFFISLGLSLLASSFYYLYAGFRYYILLKMPEQ
jgi:hypothetical protein